MLCFAAPGTKQGDVLHILNSSKQVVASYSYDPYGKVLTATGDLAEINPLRYRGKVFSWKCQQLQ